MWHNKAADGMVFHIRCIIWWWFRRSEEGESHYVSDGSEAIFAVVEDGHTVLIFWSNCRLSIPRLCNWPMATHFWEQANSSGVRRVTCAHYAPESEASAGSLTLLGHRRGGRDRERCIYRLSSPGIQAVHPCFLSTRSKFVLQIIFSRLKNFV